MISKHSIPNSGSSHMPLLQSISSSSLKLMQISSIIGVQLSDALAFDLLFLPESRFGK
jgi:hypothetical protein